MPSGHRMHRVARSSLFAVAWLAAFWLPQTAYAQLLCGDDVAGARVPCACGGVVVSDTTLSADDPVVQQRCSGDGLIVRAPASAKSIRLSLGGNSLVGTGSGAGIRVIAGGTDGAIIEGGGAGVRAVVAGFGSGLRATGRRSVAELRGIEFDANREHGVALWALDVRVTDVGAEGNGHDGVHVGGRQASLEGVEARSNGRYGVRVTAPGGEVRADGRNNRRGDVVVNGRVKAAAR
jgi:hypothetical protein